MLQRAPGWWESAKRDSDLISELQSQPEGSVAHKIKEGHRTLVEDEHMHSAFQGPWVMGVGAAGTPGPQERLCFRDENNGET